MNHKWAYGLSGLLILTLGAGAWAQGNAEPRANRAAPAGSAPQQAVDRSPAGAGQAAAAIAQAAAADKYLFLFFYREEDSATTAARQSFEAAAANLADRAMSVAVDVNSKADQAIVARYELDRAPLPLVLALAPNGAVTRSFAGQVTQSQLETAFVSPAAQKSLKALQDRKLVFICIQNGRTQHNIEAMLGVRDFAADPQYAARTEIVTLDPADGAERSFLEQLHVSLASDEAMTVLVAPPGRIVGAYVGATTKATFIAATTSAAKGCDPRSGCCGAKPAHGKKR
jgi:hypothetical protein